ncbi:MAG TPA: glycosyl hydrolase family 18 protein, partial [Anaerolineales bacterium]|nr:glycosyl hydrolase family 18 protein [Anaerolineales bacterium]
HGVKVLVSVGGWGWDEQFEVLAADPATRATFVSGLAAYAKEYNLDGLDIDWEYPDPGTSDQHFLALMQELRAALPEGKLLTAAVLAQGPTVEGILPETFPLMDFVNIMAYDASDTEHSPYAFAETAMNVWLARGLPPEKTVLGVPFYARPNWVPYRKLVESDSNAASLDVIEYLGQNVYYNGLATMEQKTQLTLTKGSGIMIWTLGYDTNDETSLLSAIYNTVHKAP